MLSSFLSLDNCLFSSKDGFTLLPFLAVYLYSSLYSYEKVIVRPYLKFPFNLYSLALASSSFASRSTFSLRCTLASYDSLEMLTDSAMESRMLSSLSSSLLSSYNSSSRSGES